VATLEEVLGRRVASDRNESIRSELRSELESTGRAIAETEDDTVTARAVATAAAQAVRWLDRDEPVCPTCMRPLARHERSAAVAVHKTQEEKAETEVRRLAEARRVSQLRAQGVSRVLAQWEALPTPEIHAEVAASSPDRIAADAAYRQASADLDEHNQRLGGVRSALESLKAQVASDVQVEEEERRLRLAYRREAVAVAGARALREAAEHVIESRIEPMAKEVRGRWKHLFTNNGLTFRPDGSITRSRDGEELRWETLSGGERTWARIVTHLIVMGTTTSLPFAWFDEPLEHLDPQLRQAVAATLATATNGGAPRQLLVTTYEHGIAQQLADDTDGAEVVAIRESGVALGGADTARG
jgi:DNA repair exonuclease SbcCD ATPase subunit